MYNFSVYEGKSSDHAEDADVSKLYRSAPPYSVRCPVNGPKFCRETKKAQSPKIRYKNVQYMIAHSKFFGCHFPFFSAILLFSGSHKNGGVNYRRSVKVGP